MATTETISQDLYDFLVTKNFDPEPMDAKGNDADAEEAKVFSFDYISGTGKNYGTGVIIIADPEDVKFFYGDNLGRSMEDVDKNEWFDFLEELSNFSTQHRHNWTPSDISKLKYTMAGIAAIKEGLFEGYYGTKRVSYMGEQTQARLVIKHNRILGENDKRYRYVESLYIETADSERFKLPFKNMTGGRAMLEHVRQGGRPYDVRGNHIAQLVTEAATLSRFNRASQHRILEGSTQELVTEAVKYYQQIRETLQHLGNGRGYAKYFESWSPVDITPQEGLVEDIKTLFIEQTLDTRIEQALPILARLQQQGNDMKEAQIFESWIDQLSEGTWSLPETPEQQEKLRELMSQPLTAGPKGSYATEELYDLVGDDQLFDIIGDIGDKNPDVNIWDDEAVQRRLEELGVYMVNQETPDAPTAPETGMTESEEHNPVASAITRRILLQRHDLLSKYGPEKVTAAIDEVADFVGDVEEIGSSDVSGWIKHVEQMLGKMNDQGVAEGYDSVESDYQQWEDILHRGNPSGAYAFNLMRGDETTIRNILAYVKQNRAVLGKEVSPETGRTVKDAIMDIRKEFPQQYQAAQQPQGVAEGDNLATFESINALRKAAGLPVTEGVLTDSTGSTLEHIKDTFKRDVKDFTATGEMSNHLFRALHDYYFDDMPYGAKTGDDIDPHEWVSDRFSADLGIDENLIAPMIAPVATESASCNMTAEGEYCPEHGLVECGMGLPASIMGETNDDPINYNAAITGSYYESREGDAVLARIKSLALLK